MGVDDLGGEPVGRNAGLHVDLDVADDWARDVVPGNIDDTLGRSGESSKGVGEEVEVVGATAWALVDNLETNISTTSLELQPVGCFLP